MDSQLMKDKMKKVLLQALGLAFIALSFSSNGAIIKHKWQVLDAESSHGLWTNNIRFNNDRFFNFDDDLFLTEYNDGTAHLYGHASDSGVSWLIDIVWDSFNENPDGNIKDGGGSLLSSWNFYHNVVSGSISTLDAGGFVANIDRVGPALQIGNGANDKTADFGASAWLDINGAGKPGHWDLNMDLAAVDVPEPSLFGLILVGLIGVGVARRRAL
jgi:hypothetical protein